MKRIYKSKISLLLAIGLVSSLTGAAQQQQLVNGVAVIVNDAVITYQEIRESLQSVVPYIRVTYENQPELLAEKLREAERERLEDLIERQLILHEFATAGYNLPESFIEDELQRRIKDEFDGDRVIMTKSLQARGMTFESYRKEVRDQYIILAMRSQNIPSKIQISPHKIEMYYLRNRDQFTLEDQVKLRMIFIGRSVLDPTQQDPGRELAQEVREKIKDGASFEEMAAIYSTGSRHDQGGDWGWLDKSVPREELAEVAFAMEPGEMSGIIDLPNGYYILKVEEKRPGHVQPLTEVKAEIEVDLRAEEQDRLRKKWIDKIKRTSFIRYY